ncbi:MAG: MCE family protein [Nocardioidaceae bacterium]|nr:MCE family protein [Nocardioidaceae bacterium]MCL2612444.1 MCE family protein [Nocardioidaceae bacterium]
MIAPARNARTIGIVTIAVCAVLLTASFRLSTLGSLFSGGGETLHAQFTDVAGISPGDPVRIAGISVGRVEAVHVQRDHALVDMSVQTDVRLGDRTTASLSLDTLLGQSSLLLTPGGTGSMADGSTIPLARTTTPFSVTDAILGAGRELTPIKTKVLTQALRTVTSAISPGASDVRTAATGLGDLSRVVSRRQQQVQTLFAQTRRIAATLAGRTTDLVTLIDNSSLITGTLVRRERVIDALLRTTTGLTRTIRAVIRDNQGQITPGLRDLHTVLGVLRRNQDDLDESLRLLAPYLRYFVNLTGNGRWFDGTFAGLVPIDTRGGGKK